MSFLPGLAVPCKYHSTSRTEKLQATLFGYKTLVLFTSILLLFNSNLFSQNAIVAENALPGNPASQWDIAGAGDQSIQGFGTELSVNKGQTIRFKIATDASNYTIAVYRIGYYQGNGARLVGTGLITAVLPQIQPTPLYEAATGKTDCSNWQESGNWAVPADAVSGVYIAKLTRGDNGGSSHIIFIVRNDASTSNLLYKTSDATWQAYNNFGGNCFYGYLSSTPVPGFEQAVKVSYNRPFSTRSGRVGLGQRESFFFNAEYAMIRWLERNGYEVSYTTQLDISKTTTPITTSANKVLLSVGHDEYWSAEERKIFEDARAGGVNLAFFSGNEVSWKTRWEDNYRTLVCYKEGGQGEYSCVGKCDPIVNVWTGQWSSGCSYPLADGCKPENALTGQKGAGAELSTSAIKVPYDLRNLRFWRNTSVQALNPGETLSLASGSLGYEWDIDAPSSTYPMGRFGLSKTTINGLDHKLSLYRHPNGALVFGAGTIYWSYGLDQIHDINSSIEDKNMQQATVNLFADMGVQPGSIQSNLVAATSSSDAQPPVSTVNPLEAGVAPSKGQAVVITGTAADFGGGAVGGIEISTDGGLTWASANGTENWSYNFIPVTAGEFDVIFRSVDDLGNIETLKPSNKITISVLPSALPSTIFKPTDAPTTTRNDGKPIEVGLKFKSNLNGQIKSIRYYKSAGNTGTIIGHLWQTTGTRSGNLLSEVTFTNQTASGWQEKLLPTPVSITAGQTYSVSTYSSSGDYSFTRPYFSTEKLSYPLVGLADKTGDGNGVYNYTFGTSPVYPYPYLSYQQSNYWVDVVFEDAQVLVLPVVVTNPTLKTICEGAQVAFNAEATSTEPVTIQWKVSSNNITWINIPGATAQILTFTTTLADNGKYYRAAFTNSAGTVYSRPATLTVAKVSAIITTQTNPGCKGTDGIIELIASGGLSPYTFSINGTVYQSLPLFNNLSSGIYSLNVKDNSGCTTIIPNVVLSQVPPLSLSSAIKSDVSCIGNDGSMTLTAMGGTAPLTYSKDGITYQAPNVFGNLLPRTYSVSVKDARGCLSSSLPVVIADYQSLILSLASKSDIGCIGNDGSITLTATGGIAPLTYSNDGINYQSSNVFSNLLPATYTVTAKDAKGCLSSSLPVVIAAYQLLNLSLASKSDVGCIGNDGSITVAASGGISPFTYSRDGINYQSSNVFGSLLPGTYIVTVKDVNGCVSTSFPVIIAAYQLLNLSITSKSDVSCIGNEGSITLIATGGTAPLTYSKDGITYQASNVFGNLLAGTYTVTVKDAKGCLSSSLPVVIAAYQPLNFSIASKSDATCIGNDGSIILASSGGVAPYSYSLNGGSFQTGNSFTALAPNTYNVTVKDAKGCTAIVSGIVINKINTLTLQLLSTANVTCVNTDGTIAVTASGGVIPYTYSINGVIYQTSNIFNGLAPGIYTVTVKDGKGCTANVTGIVIGVNNVLSLTISSKTDATCGLSDGKIVVTGSCGVPPYRYVLSTGIYQTTGTFSNLAAGIYNVYIIDSKDSSAVVSGIVISEIKTLTLNASSIVGENCTALDGSVTVAASGGKSPYQYKLGSGIYRTSNVFTNLGVGSYNLTVKDYNGCTTTLSVTVPKLAFTLALAVTVKANATCKGLDGSITVNGTGGAGSYSYSLNGGTYQSANTFNNLIEGAYSVTVKDSKGCTVIVSNIILLRISFIATLDSVTDVSCKGNDGSIALTSVGGTAPYTYSLNGGKYEKATNTLFNLKPGTYYVTVKDTYGCISVVRDIVIIKAPTLSGTVTSKTNACSNINNGSITTTATGGIAPYQFSLNGGAYQTSNTYSNLAPGSYSVKIKDAKGCLFTLSGITITRLTTTCSGRGTDAYTIGSVKTKDVVFEKGIEEKATMSIFPNPSVGSFKLNIRGLNGNKANIVIVDALGKEIYKVQTNISSDVTMLPINLDRIHKGVYFIKLSTNKFSMTEKLVIY
ncbi:MAG: DUF4082 domain-containing protein [Chitinophagaceae bacterium]|nr:DUF4082 domain-containing protein [Chitinophagaceae bacterium]